MKEKIKQIISKCLIFYTIIITIMLIISIISAPKHLNLHDSEYRLTELNEAKQKLAKLTQNECTTSIKTLISAYETTSYNGKISLRNYEWDHHLFDVTFVETKEACQLNETESKKYYIIYLENTHMLNRENIMSLYEGKYQIQISDIYANPYFLTEYYYNFLKETELIIINNFIEIINERNDSNE